MALFLPLLYLMKKIRQANLKLMIGTNKIKDYFRTDTIPRLM